MSAPRAVRAATLVVLAAFTGLVAYDDQSAVGAAPATHEVTFIDQRSGFALSVQIDFAARDAGHFTFRIPGRGAYSGNSGSAMRVLAPTSVQVSYSGPAVLRTTGPAGSTSTVDVNLQAHLDPAHMTAEATLRHGAESFHLVAQHRGVGGLQPTISAVENAIVANDPVALYPLLNASAKRAYDSSAFASLWTTQSATLGRITALRRMNESDVQTNDQGYDYVIVEYSADISDPGGRSTAIFKAFFISEPDGWKLWTTVRS